MTPSKPWFGFSGVPSPTATLGLPLGELCGALAVLSAALSHCQLDCSFTLGPCEGWRDIFRDDFRLFTAPCSHGD